jgi:hypothetical protein
MMQKYYQRILFLVVLFCSTCFFTVGFALLNFWWNELVMLISVVLFIIGDHNRNHRILDLSLVALLCVATAGIFMGVQPALMIAATTCVFFIWDMSRYHYFSQKKINDNTDQTYENNHTKMLFLSVGSGLLVAEACLLLRLTVPFGVVFLIVVVVLFSLFKFIQLIKNSEI